MVVDIVILAAGQGTRMKSQLPKVLHHLAGRPLLRHVLDVALKVEDARVVVVTGHGGDRVRESVGDDPAVSWVVQRQQLGTGHAVLQALPCLRANAAVLVLYGDVPLIQPDTLQAMLEQLTPESLSLLTVDLADPNGYGRIIRDDSGEVAAIVEQNDATAAQLSIKEVNTGVLAASAADLARWLPQIGNDNAQGEYYLTDLIGMARSQGRHIRAMQPVHRWEVEGVNSRQQLALLERQYQRNCAEQLMAEGVTLADPDRFDCRGSLTVGADSYIDINCVFEGEVVVGAEASIGPNCIVSDSRIGAGVAIKANSVLEGVEIGDNCIVGPFARLRPGTVLEEKARIGNFVETKKTRVGKGSKINHLSYVGDAEVGAGVNIGAGTITCNYDGVNKFKTTIGDGAFIGSNTSLVAPINIGAGATVGAGSAVNKNIGDGELAVARGRQRNIRGWQRPGKKG